MAGSLTEMNFEPGDLARGLLVVGFLALDFGLIAWMLRNPADDDAVALRNPAPAPYPASEGPAGVLAIPPSAPHTFDAGAGSAMPSLAGPQNAEPAAGFYQAIRLRRAGRWGPYWQEVGRCEHAHPVLDGAWACMAGLVTDELLAVGLAE